MSQINPNIKKQLSGKKRSFRSADYYIEGITARRDPFVLSEAITIVESDQKEHKDLALQILHGCYPYRVNSLRLGITGSPGVGKSTFINSTALHLTGSGHRVGILTVDPSSTHTKGSILGDKTRMDDLIDHPDVFIRPSPSIQHLGGLHPYTYEATILCEAAGMDRILIETVGVGQSEIEVNQYTDATILLVLPGGGDSLQGIKKGIVEQADMLVIHKSDGDSLSMSRASAKEYREAIHLSRAGVDIPVVNYSSITQNGKEQLLQAMSALSASATKRKWQEEAWYQDRVKRIVEDKVLEQLSQQVVYSETESVIDQLRAVSSSLTIDVRLEK